MPQTALPRQVRVPIRRRFGQHFLVDEAVVDRIFQALAIRRDDRVLEIGPGTGVLTERLCAATDRVAAIEIDRDLAAALQARLGAEVICADALATDLAATTNRLAPCRVVGNLPYNVASALLARLSPLASVRDIHVMLQAEVAARLAAQPGTKAYGRLSVLVQHHCDVQVLFAVGAASFVPAPKVGSAFVRLAQKPSAPYPAGALRRVLAAAFSARRKTVANALRSLAPDWRELGIDPQRRADGLHPGEFVAIARQLVPGPAAGAAEHVAGGHGGTARRKQTRHGADGKERQASCADSKSA